MKRRYNLLLFLLLFICCAGHLFAQRPVTVLPGAGLLDVTERAGTFLDASSSVSPQDIAAGRFDTRLRFAGRPVIHYGITRGTSWSVFRLANTCGEPVFLSIHNPIVDTVCVYKVVEGRPVMLGKTGLCMPLSTRHVKAEDFMFDLRAGADNATYIVAIRAFRDHVYSLRAGRLADHLPVIRRYTFWNAVFFGFALLLALYHIFLFLAIRNIPYLYYVGYVICFGLFNAHLNGTAFLHLWPAHPEWNNYDNLFSAVACMFSALFTAAFLDLRKRSTLYYRLSLISAWSFAVIALMVLLGFTFPAFLLVQLFIAAGVVVTISASVHMVRRGYKPARYFLAAWGLLVVGVLAFMLNNFNILPYSFFSERIMQIAAPIEALVLSFALADRFNRYKKEKEALILSQNEMLEHQVALRTEELKRQQRESEQLLLNILPEEVAAELKENGVAKSRNYEAVTVLFTDFKDFTRIVENISPEQLIADLNHCFSAFDKIIEKYGIEKIKTIGDSYMCAGGFGNNHPDNALNVVRAGIEIRNFMEERNRMEMQGGGNILEVRIGVHTGPVIAGIIGIKKFAYDIWGDTVNIASRMESAGETGKVNISGVTYELVKGDFNCTYRGKMPAKNKGEIDMYFAEPLKDR